MTLKNQALELYLTAFPEDDKAFAEDFLNRYFEKDCRFIVKDGRLVSMLFLLDASLQNGEKQTKGKYLYAAATLPEYRGQGLMAELIEEAKAETAEKGDFLLTKPASGSLFDYYARFGFKTAVFCEDKRVTLRNNVAPLKKVSLKEYLEKRSCLLKNIPDINLSDTRYTYSSFTLFGSDNTIAAVDLTGDIPAVREFVSSDLFGTDALLSAIEKNEAVFRFSGGKPFAMLILPDMNGADGVFFSLALD